MNRVIRGSIWTVVVLATICILLMLICNQIVVNNAKGKAYFDIDSIKYNKVGLLVTLVPVPMTQNEELWC